MTPAAPLVLIATLASAFQVAGLRDEVLDARECRCYLANPWELAADLREIDRRYRDLATAPRLASAAVLPDTAILDALRRFVAARREFIRDVLILYPDNDAARIDRAIHDRLYTLYDLCRDARGENCYVHVRRDALRQAVRIAAYFGCDLLRGELPGPDGSPPAVAW